MEQIHFRPWEKGIIGKELKVPFPVSNKLIAQSPKKKSTISLNYSSRKTENERIEAENVKLF